MLIFIDYVDEIKKNNNNHDIILEAFFEKQSKPIYYNDHYKVYAWLNGLDQPKKKFFSYIFHKY